MWLRKVGCALLKLAWSGNARPQQEGHQYQKRKICRFASVEPMTVGAVPLAAALHYLPPRRGSRQRFLPFATGFWQGGPDRVRAKQRGARRSGNGSRVERS